MDVMKTIRDAFARMEPKDMAAFCRLATDGMNLLASPAERNEVESMVKFVVAAERFGHAAARPVVLIGENGMKLSFPSLGDASGFTGVPEEELRFALETGGQVGGWCVDEEV